MRRIGLKKNSKKSIGFVSGGPLTLAVAPIPPCPPGGPLPPGRRLPAGAAVVAGRLPCPARRRAARRHALRPAWLPFWLQVWLHAVISPGAATCMMKCSILQGPENACYRRVRAPSSPTARPPRMSQNGSGLLGPGPAKSGSRAPDADRLRRPSPWSSSSGCARRRAPSRCRW